MEYTGERFIPGNGDEKLAIEHIQRYRLAKKLVAGKVVLDAACGEGYGSCLLAESAQEVIGIDKSAETISHAQITYSYRENLSFLCGDIADLKDIRSESIDVVVSFETIEHVPETVQKRFLKEIRRVLRRNGLLIMSTPNTRVYSELFNYHNEFHVREFSRLSFQTFLKTRFKNIRLLAQAFEVNCIISDETDASEAAEFSERNDSVLDNCKYFIALASNGELPKANLKSVYVGNYGEYTANILRILELQEEEKSRNNHISRLDTELEEKGEYIFGLQRELEDKEKTWSSRVDENHSALTLVTEQFAKQITGLQDSSTEFKVRYELMQEQAAKAEKELAETKTALREAERVKEELNVQISALSVQKGDAERNAEELRAHVAAQEEQCGTLKAVVEELEDKIQRLKDNLQQEASRGNTLTDTLEQKEREFREKWDCLVREHQEEQAEQEHRFLIQLEEKDGKIADLHVSLQELQEEADLRGKTIEEQKDQLTRMQEQEKQSREAAEEKDRRIRSLEEKEKAEDLRREQQEQRIREYTVLETHQKEKIEALSQSEQEWQDKYHESRQQIGSLERELETERGNCLQLTNSLNEKNKETEKTLCLLEEKEQQLVTVNDQLVTVEGQLDTARDQVAATMDQLVAARDQLVILTGAFEDKVKELNQIIANKKGHIEQLLETEREFVRIQQTRSYKLGMKVHRLSERLIPGGSTRRFVLGTLLKVVCHPVKMIRFLTPHRIRKFFWLKKMGGWDAVQYRFRVLEANELTDPMKSDAAHYDISEIDGEKALEEYQKIRFEYYAYPDISIVIPVYNQFAYTYQCLQSIQEHTAGIGFEIIIGDDHSTDQTADISTRIENITIVQNEGDKGFLYNCRTAAAHARGRYILFLNNDTQVQENWLKPLLDIMEADEKIGLTGSKLIYADGTLQEAGGIVWSDGSAWNYGNGKNPEDPEYNYVKDVDYISGACIMIRKDLWKELDGFDPAFAPAYYEDTDLAFRVRQAGYRVVYQPLSQVVHFEGISNGKDTTQGLKTYQVVNQQKFYRRWRDILESEHFPNGKNVFLAKDRSRSRKQILVIDHYVPHYDNDAGGRCTFMWMKMFTELGMKVTFIGDNFYKHEPYTTVLNQMGIEVLYGNFYYYNWKEWLKENLHYFDYIYLQRPHISVKYMDLVKQYGRGKVFYFAHDLHFLRLTREYELTGDEKILLQAEEIRKTEMDLFEKADVVHVVGSFEQQYLADILPNKIIRNIPLYIYESLPEQIEKDFSKRQDIIFVGGFGHPPNTDAVLWFAKEIYPTVLKAYPDIRWHIVGGKVPDEVANLQNDHIIVHGFLPDQDLEHLYRTCRLAVVPLRYGAGVKGKVIEAAYYQIPLVTTTIGGEGIPHENCFAIEDDPEKMAQMIVQLYGDFGKLEAMSDAGTYLIQNNYNIQSARKIFLQDA